MHVCAVQRIDRAHIKQQAAKEAARRASSVISLVSSAVLPESLYAGAVQDNYVKDYLKYVSVLLLGTRMQGLASCSSM